MLQSSRQPAFQPACLLWRHPCRSAPHQRRRLATCRSRSGRSEIVRIASSALLVGKPTQHGLDRPVLLARHPALETVFIHKTSLPACRGHRFKDEGLNCFLRRSLRNPSAQTRSVQVRDPLTVRTTTEQMKIDIAQPSVAGTEQGLHVARYKISGKRTNCICGSGKINYFNNLIVCSETGESST